MRRIAFWTQLRKFGVSKEIKSWILKYFNNIAFLLQHCADTHSKLEQNHGCRRDNATSLDCSGKGKCINNVCECEKTDEGRYRGKYCEKCPTCYGRCSEFKECVQCRMYKTGPMGDDPDLCVKNCTKFVPKGVEEVRQKEGDHLCTFYDNDDCRFDFVYNDNNENDIKVYAKDKLACPTIFSYFRSFYEKIF